MRKNNSTYLTPKATALREMAAYLLGQKKTVVLLLPPIGEDRIEISQQVPSASTKDYYLLATCFTSMPIAD